ncbi:hypothetical protein Pcinc_025589 [Petrolisthes cinctipes]|uniref:Uncharacterized protein n=1 Tax=Petrolisthes cinctipes TaxID=88211 RepID=A0AAE1K991_PETCI|nr:hypothetical protein Pcinc_025589 [Petrolisthes cinctipes]
MWRCLSASTSTMVPVLLRHGAKLVNTKDRSFDPDEDKGRGSETDVGHLPLGGRGGRVLPFLIHGVGRLRQFGGDGVRRR